MRYVVKRRQSTKKWDNAFQILGVAPDSTDSHVKATYKKLMQKNHPDRAATEEDRYVREKVAIQLNDAYEKIQTAAQRATYNPDPRMAEVAANVMSVFEKALADLLEVGDRNFRFVNKGSIFDVVKETFDQIQQMRFQRILALKAINKKLKRLEKKITKHGQNGIEMTDPFIAHVRNHRASNLMDIKSCYAHIEMSFMAIDYIEGYDTEFVAPQTESSGIASFYLTQQGN